MPYPVTINDQPISATFFDEGRWLTDFVTPEALEVQKLHKSLTEDIQDKDDRLLADWAWVANQVKYVKYVKAKVWINGKSDTQLDYWQTPSQAIRTRIGNCLVKGTKILTFKNGHYEIKPIEELQNFEDTSVVSYNWQSGKIEVKPVINFFDNGTKEIISARFNNGEILQATPEHRIFHEGKEITLENAISGGASISNIKQLPPAGYIQGFKGTKEFLWLTGMYLAEGHTGNSHVVICNDDEKLLSRIESSLNKLDNPFSRTNYKHSNYIRILKSKSKKNLKAEFSKLGHKAAEKHLTSQLLSAGRNQLIEIMQGYCDGDGYLPCRNNRKRLFSSKHMGKYNYKNSFILQYGTASEELADQLKLIHLILGRPLWYNYQLTSHGVGKNPSYGRVNGYRDLGQLKIKEILGVSHGPVYDIEVADNHNFMLANGTLVHNCANKSFLLASLLRNELPEGCVNVVLGNLNQPPRPGGHAWVEVSCNGQPYIMESTRGDMKPMVSSKVADVYESVLYFNDKEVMAIEGRTLLQPFCDVYADWLKEYLDWAFIEGRK